MVGHHLSKVLNGKFFAQEVRRGSLAVGELLRDEDGGDRIGKPDLRSHDTPPDLSIALRDTIRPPLPASPQADLAAPGQGTSGVPARYQAPFGTYPYPERRGH